MIIIYIVYVYVYVIGVQNSGNDIIIGLWVEGPTHTNINLNMPTQNEVLILFKNYLPSIPSD